MDSEQKLTLLTSESAFEVSSRQEGRPAAGARPAASQATAPCGKAHPSLTQVRAPQGTITLMKVLQTNACCMDCGYCFTRAGRDTPRATYRPEELANLFHGLYRAGLAQGLFLSSAIPHSGARAMDEELKTADILRKKLGYTGYLHLKVMPGCEREQIAEACRLADRVSINLEAPTEAHLQKLSRRKSLEKDILQRVAWVAEESRKVGLRSGHTTQFVLGAAGEADRDVMGRLNQLYSEFYLRRAHFSAFTPLPGTPLDGVPPTPRVREQRLYQADFLMRQYRLPLSELPFNEQGNLPLSLDPKLAIALRVPGRFPVEVNTSDLEALLEVPGIGPLSARRILSRRAGRTLRDLEEMRALGVVTRRAAPFITINGHPQGNLVAYLRDQERKASEPVATQLQLW